MLRSFLLPALALMGCAPQSGPNYEPKPTTSDTTTTSSVTTSTTQGPTDTGATSSAVTTDFDCSAPWPQAPFQVNSLGIGTQEDFDFSGSGHLVYQGLTANALIGVDRTASEQILSPGTAGDPRGIHGLSDGRVVIMSIWDGSIKVTDPYTGGIDTITSGLNLPNGIDVGDNDRLFFSTYGELGWSEVDGSNYQVVHTFGGASQAGNGVALNATQDRVTVAVSEGNDTSFVSLEKLGPDDWGNPVIDYTVSSFHSTVEYDVCGNIYTTDYFQGILYRIQPDGTIETLADFGSGAFSAIRFGPGHSGWERDRLYVSNRNVAIHEVFIGIPGVLHPTSP